MKTDSCRGEYHEGIELKRALRNIDKNWNKDNRNEKLENKLQRKTVSTCQFSKNTKGIYSVCSTPPDLLSRHYVSSVNALASPPFSLSDSGRMMRLQEKH